jgi:alpha/beta superfamily hydrolase
VALYQPARAGAEAGRAVVLCNPFGQEAIRAHRFFRILSQRLATAGVDVLRFDYFGTGDSAGDDAQFDLEGAVLDTLAAAELLRGLGGARHLVFAGLRLGAAIAALAAREASSAGTRLALIEPVVDGVAYLRSLDQAHARTLAQIYGARWRVDRALRELLAPAGPNMEALGFELGVALRGQLAGFPPTAAFWQHIGIDMLLLSQDERLCAEWARWQADGRLEVAHVEGAIDWTTNSALNTSLVPVPWVERIVRFVTGEIAGA